MDHNLYAINPDTYEFAWPSIDLGGAAPGTPLVGPNGNVYIGSFASDVIKVDPATGSDSLLTSTQGWVWGGPVTDGQNIYFGDIDGNLFAIGAENGNQIWSKKPDDSAVGSPLVIDKTIVFATESGSVFAINQDGSPAWQIDVGGQIYTTPVTGSNLILIAPLQADFQLYAYPADGSSSNPTWTFPPAN